MTLRSMMRAARPDGSRAKNPVRAQSLPSGGTWERDWHCTWSKGQIQCFTAAARRVRRRLSATRRKLKSPAERAKLPVPSKSGLDILEAVVSMAAGLVGRKCRLLVLSYRELANRADCSVETVRRQIVILKAAGLLKWQRRCRRTEAPPQFGLPQWEQDTNVYQLAVPHGVVLEHRRASRERDRRHAQAVAAAASEQRAASHPSPNALRPPFRQAPDPQPRQGPQSAVFYSEELRRRAAALQHETGKMPERPDHQEI